jgi:DNA-binding transcriptional MerR regulator
MTGFLEIGAVARELGVAPSTLRTWENRYHVIVPHRGDQGQRLYDEEQVVTLRRVLAQIRRGVRARTAHEAAVSPSPLRAYRGRLEPSLDAALQARHLVDALLDDAVNTRFAFHLRLVVSELVNNAVLYGSKSQPIRIAMTLFQDYADVEVQNGGLRLTLKVLRARRQDGHGLDIVDALADAWSIDTGPLGTKVTVRLPIEGPAAA